uniref:Uncharacterized protein n=1 Tax=Aegilops tauschii subsp. strangulata TaxID=200361 RepID=A0A453EFB0_AEGTS
LEMVIYSTIPCHTGLKVSGRLLTCLPNYYIS